MNLIILIIFLIIYCIIKNSTNSLNLLIIIELIWILLYSLSLFFGIFYDNVYILSLTFFFLVVSAVELSNGLSILALQNNTNKSLNLNYFDVNKDKFLFKTLNKLFINKINFVIKWDWIFFF